MIDDPYKVLGVSRDATPEEIKKAYRQKAKQYHPDLHPNDPKAQEKMNEINTAYDMITNPQKYEAKRAQQQQRSSYGGYGGQSGYGGQGGYGNQQYGHSGQNYNGYRGPGGWSSDDFGFEDFFGFGFNGGQRQAASTRPQEEPGDSMEFRRAVSEINGGRYQEAVRILTNIPSTGRNARWYYLSALANHGLGNTVQATVLPECIGEPWSRKYGAGHGSDAESGAA